MKKYQFEVEMLGDVKNKAAREAGDALLKANIVERRAEDAEAALRGAIQENSRLLEKIKKLEA